jgi:hypothetical protein
VVAGLRLKRRRLTLCACLGTPGNPALRLFESVGFREFSRDAELLKRKSA